VKVFSNRKGRSDFDSYSHVVFRGIYHECVEDGIRYILDLAGRLKWIFIESASNIFEAGHLFRQTIGGKWLYYDGSLYSEAYSLCGRHYVPVALDLGQLAEYGHEKALLNEALRHWDNWTKSSSPTVNGTSVLETRGVSRMAFELRNILKATIPVIPPETIFVDYEVWPVIVSEGCKANCKFCCVKTGSEFRQRSYTEVRQSIRETKSWFGPEAVNFSSIFLGQNDALSVHIDLLAHTAATAFGAFGKEGCFFKEKRLFLFGSPISILEKSLSEFRQLDGLPFDRIHINVGIESLDEETLEIIGRPFKLSDAQSALNKIDQIHSETKKIEIGVNFLLGEHTGANHLKFLLKWLSTANYMGKGYVFVSPMVESNWGLGRIKRSVLDLKSVSKIPLFMYILVPFL